MTNNHRLSGLAGRLSLLLPLTVGAFLRFASLGKQPLFLDEAFTADLVLRSWVEMLQVIMTDVHPPLFYVLLKPIVAIFPLTEWTLRSLSAFCSVLALALAIGLARRLGGPGIASTTGWVLSWSALHLYYAQDARMYALLDVWWVLAALASFSALWDRNRLAWLVWSIVTLAAIYTHFYGFVLWGVGAFGGWTLILCRRRWRDLRWWGFSQMVILAGTIPLISLFIHVAQTGVGGTWVPSWRDLLDLLALMLLGFSPVHNHFLNGHLLVIPPWDFSRGTGEFLAFILTGLALTGWGLRGKLRKRPLGWLLGVYAWLPLCLATFLLWAAGRRFWAYRPFIGVATLAAVGLASGWHFLLSRRWRIALIGVLFGLNLGSLWAYEFHWVKDYGRVAFRALSDQPALLLDRHYGAYVFYFYRPDWNGELFGLVPRSDRPYGVVRLTREGSLRGRAEAIECEDLPIQIALYDPAGRRFSEGDRWPPCLREREGWLFNPATGRWEVMSSLIP